MLSRTTCHGGGMDAGDCTVAEAQAMPAAAASLLGVQVCPPQAAGQRRAAGRAC